MSLSILFIFQICFFALASGDFWELKGCSKEDWSCEYARTNLELIPPFSFSGYDRMERLGLYRNKLRLPEQNAFFGLTNLKSLTLSNNQIGNGTFATGVFSNLKNLEYLSLETNGLTTYDGLFDGLTSLRKLELYDNPVTSLSEKSFRDLTSLRNLQFYRNQVASIGPNTFDYMPSLLYLSASNNKIENFDSVSFDKMVSLEEISFRDNLITHIPSNKFSSIASLRSVFLQENLIKTIGDNAFALPGTFEFIELNIKNNTINYIGNNCFAEVPFFKADDSLVNAASSPSADCKQENSGPVCAVNNFLAC
jgi:Leucine-rich repeat (LRR) protein